MKIKVCLLFIWAFMGLVAISSCSSDENSGAEPTLTINPINVNVEAVGGDVDIHIEATDVWTATVAGSNSNWLKIKTADTKTGQLTLAVEANTTATIRSVNVVVKLNNTDISKKIEVKQVATSVVFTVSPMEVINISAKGADHKFTVEHDAEVDWTYEIPEEHRTWIKEKSKEDKSVEFSFTANTASQRGCYITFKDKNQKAKDVQVKVIQLKPDSFDPNDPTSKGYVLQGSMQAGADLVGKTYSDVHTYMRTFGWDYSEHPNSSDKDHNVGNHIETVYDATLKQYVFRFISHASTALDGDRGSLVDRQRNEMKTQTSANWYKLNGNWGESQVLEWKFKIPKGYRPSTSFCHIHQLKAQEGDNGSPVITISLRGNNDGTNRRLQVIHSLGDDKSAGTAGQGTFVDNVKIEEFEDEWVQVQEEVMYAHHGTYRVLITRIRDNRILVDAKVNDIDTWRKGAINIRNKFGIYRSYGSTNGTPNNGIKDETLELADFVIYEKDTNPNPVAHD